MICLSLWCLNVDYDSEKSRSILSIYCVNIWNYYGCYCGSKGMWNIKKKMNSYCRRWIEDRDKYKNNEKLPICNKIYVYLSYIPLVHMILKRLIVSLRYPIKNWVDLVFFHDRKKWLCLSVVISTVLQIQHIFITHSLILCSFFPNHSTFFFFSFFNFLRFSICHLDFQWFFFPRFLFFFFSLNNFSHQRTQAWQVPYIFLVIVHIGQIDKENKKFDV